MGFEKIGRCQLLMMLHSQALKVIDWIIEYSKLPQVELPQLYKCEKKTINCKFNSSTPAKSVRNQCGTKFYPKDPLDPQRPGVILIHGQRHAGWIHPFSRLQDLPEAPRSLMGKLAKNSVNIHTMGTRHPPFLGIVTHISGGGKSLHFSWGFCGPKIRHINKQFNLRSHETKPWYIRFPGDSIRWPNFIPDHWRSRFQLFKRVTWTHHPKKVTIAELPGT